jgi:hypothetical protein
VLPKKKGKRLIQQVNKKDRLLHRHGTAYRKEMKGHELAGSKWV